MLDGTSQKLKKQKRRFLMLIPIMFFVRRFAFVCSALLMRDLLWGQLTIQIYISLGMCALIQWLRPLESRYANNIETFNEATMILLCYLLLCFTDFVPSAETRSTLGLYYICVGLGNIAIHLMIMLTGSLVSLKQSCRTRMLRRKARIKYEQKKKGRNLAQ